MKLDLIKGIVSLIMALLSGIYLLSMFPPSESDSLGVISRGVAYLLILWCIGAACWYGYLWWRGGCGNARRVIIVGGDASSKDSIVQRVFGETEDSELQVLQLPTVMVSVDSERNRDYLASLKATPLSPKLHIIIAMDVETLNSDDVNKKQILLANINRVIYLLCSDLANKTLVDLILTDLEDVIGYSILRDWSVHNEWSLILKANEDLMTQLTCYQQYSDALIQMEANQFEKYVGYFYWFQPCIENIEFFTEALLLRGQQKTSYIYI